MARSKPNVVFFIMHDIGKRYGCYGNRAAVTPNIDALCRESVRFDSHFIRIKERIMDKLAGREIVYF